ncbi:hypothetical protein BLNAU_10668 [Blattamonas nauphoetae]|uniref:Uncharacterized protein n=1 Tax=Blattamonas nauphoetae TaxID=2049346 RepID=A0ABQ9XPI3_9EUKA|nr:hypothetical protein BLNAU_10668 [Blattamonas nauphoetae]
MRTKSKKSDNRYFIHSQLVIPPANPTIIKERIIIFRYLHTRSALLFRITSSMPCWSIEQISLPLDIPLQSLSLPNPSTVFSESRFELRSHPSRTVLTDWETSVDSPPLEAPLSGGGDYVLEEPLRILSSTNPTFDSFLEAIHNGSFLRWSPDEMDSTAVRGEFVLFNEHRLLPCDKRSMFRYFQFLFPKTHISEHKMYRMTKVMVHQASIRTDVCSVCAVGEQLRTQGRHR